MKLYLSAALSLAVVASPAFATTISFAGNNSSLGHTNTYGMAPNQVTASAFSDSGSSLSLYGKNGGGSENGVGITGNSDDEINHSSFIQLDVSHLAAPSFVLSIGSTQAPSAPEGFEICLSATSGTLGSSCTLYSGVTAPTSDPFTTLTITPGTDFVDIQAYGSPSSGNVLLDSLTTVSAATPEPSSLLLLGTGVLGAAGAIRRRFVA